MRGRTGMKPTDRFYSKRQGTVRREEGKVRDPVGMKRIVIRGFVGTGEAAPAGTFLARKTGLTAREIEDALAKGALRLKRPGRKRFRPRKGDVPLGEGDALEFFYDEGILSRVPPRATLVEDRKEYSVWFKPPGLMTQGSPWGDHCSLERQAELHFRGGRTVYLLHRLDREAAGLVLLGHTKKTAAALSRLFREGAIEKRYRVEVSGRPATPGGGGVIDLPLDGKKARTDFHVVSWDGERNVSEIEVILQTGRLHQIRRHFEAVGCPVLGDPRYGKGNRNREGMKIKAFSLTFPCPVRGGVARFSL